MDGSYFKVRSVEIYYDIAKEIISKLKIAKARIYLRGMNLFSHDSINIVDPEEIGMDISYTVFLSFRNKTRILIFILKLLQIKISYENSTIQFQNKYTLCS